MSTITRPQSTELIVRFQRRPEAEHADDHVASLDYDISWPDGRPVQTGLSRFCNFGSRLLLGRRYEGGTALVRLIVHPVPGLEATLTRPGGGVRCRRLYALRRGDSIRLHFLDGRPTEVIFEADKEEPPVLRWLQADRMQPGEAFWFDLGSETLEETAYQPFQHRQETGATTAWPIRTSDFRSGGSGCEMEASREQVYLAEPGSR